MGIRERRERDLALFMNIDAYLSGVQIRTESCVCS